VLVVEVVVIMSDLIHQVDLVVEVLVVVLVTLPMQTDLNQVEILELPIQVVEVVDQDSCLLMVVMVVLVLLLLLTQLLNIKIYHGF
jgi:hypothetical protein